jgi:hypothetical protein
MLALFQRARCRVRQILKDDALLWTQAVRAAMDYAYGSNALAVAREHWRAGIEADARPSGDEWIGGEARVARGIGHFQDVFMQDCMSTKRLVARELGDTHKADVGLEPYPVFVNQTDQGDWRSARGGRHTSQRIEDRLGP